MSNKEETPKATQEPEAAVDATAEFADELEIVDAMKPTPATASTDKPLKYGNRKKKAGEAGPNIQSLGSVNSLDEEEEIEMDDLPVRANVPEALIDSRNNNPSEPREERGESRPRRQNRSRGERRERKPREPRERTPEKTEAPTAEAVETSTEDETQDTNRPDRFGTVKQSQASDQIQEFRPSRDGRTAPKRERRPRREAPVSVAKPKKKGLLSKIVAFFTGGEEKEEEKKSPQNRGPRNRNSGGRRGPQNRNDRNKDGEGGNNNGNRRRRRKPRNRKPRQDGEAGPNKPRGNREGSNGNNNRRRRRRPRRQGEGQGNRERQQTNSD